MGICTTLTRQRKSGRGLPDERLVAVELGSDTLVAHATDLRWRVKVVQMPTLRVLRRLA